MINEDLLLGWLEHNRVSLEHGAIVSTHVSTHELDTKGCYAIERNGNICWFLERRNYDDHSSHLIAAPLTLNDAKQAAQYHFEMLQESKGQRIERPEIPAVVPAMVFDCDYHYFKPSGKWYASGEGVFPSGPLWKLDRNMIVAENGSMPGLSGRAEEFTIVVVPRDNCESRFACPMMLASGAF